MSKIIILFYKKVFFIYYSDLTTLFRMLKNALTNMMAFHLIQEQNHVSWVETREKIKMFIDGI